MRRRLGKDDKGVIVSFKIPSFLLGKLYTKNLGVCRVAAVSKVCLLGYSPYSYRKCRLGCLIVLGNNEFSGSGTSLDSLGRS